MADDVARLLVQVSATTELLRSNLSKAERAVADFERATNKQVGKVDRNFARMGNSLSGLKSQLAGAVAGFSLVLATKEMARFADASSKIQAQLRLATRESGSFAKAQEDVRRIAAGTRSDLGAVASLYAVMTRNSASLGATQEEVARATDTVTKAFKISGASQDEAANATRQLSQALASGTLRGDEFNSIMENGPRLAKLLADSLGVPIGKLREMSQEGELTSEKLFSALNDRKFTAGLDAEFKEVPATFGDAMTAVTNAATETFGAFDRGGQFSQALFNFASDGSANMASLTAAAEENGRQIRAIYEGLSSAWAPFKQAGIAALDAIGIKASSIGDFVRKAISFNLRNTQALLNEGAAQFLPGGVRPFTFADAFDAKSNASLRGSRKTLPGGHGGASPAAIGVTRFTPAAKKGAKGPKGPSEATLAGRAARQAERADDEIDKFNDEMGRNAAEIDGLMAELAGSLRGLADAQIERLDADKNARIRDINDRDNLSDANKKILIAQEEDLGLKRKAIVEQELAGRLVEQENEILSDRLDTYRSIQDVARTAADRAEIEENILALQHEIETATLEQLIATGKVTNATEARANLLLRQRADTVSARRANLGPGGAFLDDLTRTTGQLKEDFEEIEVRGLRSLNDGITEAIVNGKSLGSVFKNVANSIISDLVRIAIQQSVIQPLANSLFGGSGGGGIFGSILGAASSAFGGAGGVKSTGNILGRASGGPVNAGQPYIVGERRPELFVPNISGRIVPNIAGMGGQAINLTVNAPGATMETVAMIRRELANAAPMIVNAARNATQRDLTRQRL